MRKYYNRLRDDFKALYQLKAAPKEIAKGVAIGIMLDFIPSVGAGAALSAVFSSWWGGNMTASVIANLACGPLIPLFYALNIIVGRFLLGRLTPKVMGGLLHYSLERVSPRWLLPVVQHRSLRWLRMFGPDFVLGCIVNAVLCFVVVQLVVILIFRLRPHRND